MAETAHRDLQLITQIEQGDQQAFRNLRTRLLDNGIPGAAYTE